MLISYSDLSEDAVYSLAKEWIVSNLSDIESQPNVPEWTEKTIEKIKKGELLIEFGEESQTVYLKTKEQLNFQASDSIPRSDAYPHSNSHTTETDNE